MDFQIIVKNTGLFKKEKKTATKKEAKNGKLTLAEKVAKYIQKNEKEITQTIELVFVEEEVDKNTLYKVIESVGEIKEFALLKLPELVSNLKKIAGAYKVNMDDNTAKYLVECSGTSMQELINEIRKLIEYKGENETITKDDIDKLCIKQIQAVIFDLTDNLGKKETGKALDVYYGLLSNKEPIQKILITLYNDKTQARYFEEQELRNILNELINLDANYKVGLIDLNIGLEAVLCKYCS